MVNQSEFWYEIKRKKGKSKGPRIVPAFTIQSLQANTIVAKPPSLSPYAECLPRFPSVFREYYEHGKFELSAERSAGGIQIVWKIEPRLIDYSFYLPVFFDGLIELNKTYFSLAEKCIEDLLEKGGPCQVIPNLPRIVMAIKRALDTKNQIILCRTLRTLQKIARMGNCMAEAMIPHYRQILPTFGLYKERHINYGEAIDYAQQRGESVPDLVQETLEIFELYGGEDAFINIKYHVPTYESCVRNRIID